VRVAVNVCVTVEERPFEGRVRVRAGGRL